jgi:hypothetical protein
MNDNELILFFQKWLTIIGMVEEAPHFGTPTTTISKHDI